MINISKDIILYICKYLKLSDIFNYRMSCKYINRIITQYLYKNKQFCIYNELLYNSANCNIQHIRITEIFPNIQHKFYNLISLKFADNFNQDISSLSGSFPDLTNLHLGFNFNQDISSLSGSFPDLTNLHLGFKFNQDISSLAGSFPNLTNLDLGWYFNQDISSLAGSFPNLTNLDLGNYFNKDISSLAGSFPNLTELHLGKIFNQDISSLEQLILSSKIYQIGHYDNNLDEMYNNYIKKLKNK
jgi:hypothetical protein